MLIIYETPHCMLKAILVSFLIVAHFLAAYTTIDLVLTYLDYGVTTTTRTMNEVPVEFPKITICNQNMFTTKYAFDFLVKHFKQENFSDKYTLNLQSNFLMNIMNGQINSMTNMDKQRLGHSLSDSMLSCKFNFERCTAADFTWSFDPYYGNCFSFNSDGLKSSTLSGPVFGLVLEFYVNVYEPLYFFNSISGGIGAVIRVDNVSHIVDHAMGGIVVAPGFSTHIALHREFKSLLPKPYSSCDLDVDSGSFDSELFKLIKHSAFDYTQNFCLIQCVQRILIQQVNCVTSLFASVFANASICSSPEVIQKAFQVFTETYMKRDYVKRVCLPHCPLECNTRFFKGMSTSYALLGDSYVDFVRKNKNLSGDFLSRNITVQVAKESVARIDIFYESLSYTKSEESPQWSLVSLLATIGGNLGLYLGVSLFSFSEILTTLFEMFFYFRERQKKRILSA